MLNAPVIAAPPTRGGQGFRTFVPNNDLDAVGGDPSRIAEIRAPKLIRPILLGAEMPLLYLWNFADSADMAADAQRLCVMAQNLYQLGRGVDMAWASGEIIPPEEADARLAAYGGAVYRPCGGIGAIALSVPLKGSLDSLIARHMQTLHRFQTLYETKRGKAVAAGQVFSQPRKPRFGQAAYECRSTLLLFELVGVAAPWRLDHIVELAGLVRDKAACRLKQALPDKAACIERVLVGRGATEADKPARVRITPLPSIGQYYADHLIRRILVDIPSNCPLRAEDLAWAFSGLPLLVSDQGEILSELVAATDRGMLRHYGIEPDTAARRWRTITPMALPQAVARRRIDATRLSDTAERKGGLERVEEERRAAGAVVQALRHAAVGSPIAAVRVQREPFSGHGRRAEPFAAGTRFAKERLWHVELDFAQPRGGPLIIGDGRYLGLGLMAPITDCWRDLAIFELAEHSRVETKHQAAFLNAVRRAVMSLSRRADGTVPRLFSGHEANGAPARSGQHEHVFLAAADLDADGRIDRLIAAAPWRCDRSVTANQGAADLFDRVMSSLRIVRAGKLGVISLANDDAATEDCKVVGPARVWENHTCYIPTRPVRRGDDFVDVLRRDLVAECRRRGFPMPEVALLDDVPGNDGLIAPHLRLSFAVAVTGPVVLGHNSHRGAGLFLASS